MRDASLPLGDASSMDKQNRTATTPDAPAEQEREPIAEFIRRNNVSLSAVYTDTNALMDDRQMDHWKCTFRCDTRRMTVTFSKGLGHNGAEPTVDEVLDCLASDSAGMQNARGFDDWCAEYGYDTDSRKAEKIYNACVKQHDGLLSLLGQTEFDKLLWNTERL